MSQLEVRHRFQSDPQTVWQSVTDHESLPRWSPLKSVTLRTEGTPDRNGLGAVRVMRGAGPAIVEEVVAWDPPNSYGYRLLGGAPLRNHAGHVSLRPVGEGTEVTWTVTFDPALPGTGWLLVRVLRAALAGVLRRMARDIDGTV